MDEERPVLVLGGTGHYGRNIVASLVDAGTPVRVLTRNIARARETLGDTPEIMEGDLTHADSMLRALDDVRAVVVAVSAMHWATARQRKLIEQDSVIRVIEECRKTGCERVVCLSGYDVTRKLADEAGVLAFAEPYLAVQDALAASDLNWTVLGCAPSMEVFFAMIRGTVMNVPGGGPPLLPTVAARDLGVVAAAAACRDDLGGRRIRVCAPKAYSFPDAARTIGQVWGRDIRVRKIPIFPFKVIGTLLRPFNPYVHILACSVKLLNRFPQEVAKRVPEDHAALVEMFGHEPTTLEMEAEARKPAKE